MNAPQENVVSLEGKELVPHPGRAIGNILVEEGKLDPSNIEQIMELQRAKGLRFVTLDQAIDP